MIGTENETRDLMKFFVSGGSFGCIPDWYADLAVAAHFFMLPTQAALWRTRDPEYFATALRVVCECRKLADFQGARENVRSSRERESEREASELRTAYLREHAEALGEKP